MKAGMFDAEGVPRGLMTGPEDAIARTAWVNGHTWRKVDDFVRAVADVPHLSELPPQD